ncbi:MFS general substrate transporter [Hypoxylon sp. FL0543]|nr:MFS general substrate transporter [Hypoxylon sp. FL0543]
MESPIRGAGRDVELARGPSVLVKETEGPDPTPRTLAWAGPDDPANPQNWPQTRRWLVTLLVSLYMLVSPVSSSIVAPALPIIQDEFRIPTAVEAQMVLSIFVLASAVGPLVISPLSEVYGRRPVLQLTCLFYMIFNLACAFSRTAAQLLVFRFLSGLGGSAPAIGGGILADCWRPEERGRSLKVYYFFPLVGPAVGPIVGGFIMRYSNWRWIFYSTSILNAVIQAVGLFALPETFPLKILQEKARRDAKAHGEDAKSRADNYESSKGTWSVLATAMVRPAKLLTTQPIVQLLALYTAYIYGLMYLALSTFSSVWTQVYGESDEIAGLNYISLALGFTLSTQLMAPVNDHVYSALKRRNHGNGLPEHRVPLLIPSAILIPAGFFWYGWSVQAQVHWIMPNIGSVLFGFGIINGMQTITSYTVDAYPLYAASATAALTVFRAFAGFGWCPVVLGARLDL